MQQIPALVVPTFDQVARIAGHDLAGLQLPKSALHVPAQRTTSHEGRNFTSSELGLLIPTR